MSKTYILQKDLPDGAKIGDKYVKGEYRYYNQRIHDEAKGIIESVNWETWQVENNPEWFLPEENKSNDSFQWDDDLVADFGRQLLAIYIGDDDMKRNPFPKLNSFLFEFKEQPHTPKPQAENKPDWEIVAFKKDGKLLELDEWKWKYRNEINSISDMGWLLKNCETHSVKRLSDGITFSVGDEVGYGSISIGKQAEYHIGKIEEFHIMNGGHGDEMWGCGSGFNFPINFLSKPKSKPQEQIIDEFFNEKNYEKLAAHLKLFTQQQVDELCRDAFDAGRFRIGGFWNDQIKNWKWSSYGDYKSNSQNQKQ